MLRKLKFASQQIFILGNRQKEACQLIILENQLHIQMTKDLTGIFNFNISSVPAYNWPIANNDAKNSIRVCIQMIS